MEITVNLSITLQKGEFQPIETRLMDKFIVISISVLDLKQYPDWLIDLSSRLKITVKAAAQTFA